MRAHPPDTDPRHMPDEHTATGSHRPPRYEIHVRGPLGPTIMQAFPMLAASRRGQDTVLSGSLPDQAALYGVVHELETLGLQLLQIRRLPDGDPERPVQSPDPSQNDPFHRPKKRGY
jgi:epsilon-lactone hydrolase